MAQRQRPEAGKSGNGGGDETLLATGISFSAGFQINKNGMSQGAFCHSLRGWGTSRTRYIVV